MGWLYAFTYACLINIVCIIIVVVFVAQDVLLGFVQQFGQQKLSPMELQKILQLFQHSDIPMVIDHLCRNMTTRVKLGHMKNALFGVLTIAMYTTPKSAFFI